MACAELVVGVCCVFRIVSVSWPLRFAVALARSGVMLQPHEAALPIVLSHTGTGEDSPSAGLLACASCVCVAWRDEARKPSHLRVLDARGVVNATALRALLRRCAPEAERIVLSKFPPASWWPRGVSIPRLTNVRVYDDEIDGEERTFDWSHEDAEGNDEADSDEEESLAEFLFPSVERLARAAPRLAAFNASA